MLMTSMRPCLLRCGARVAAQRRLPVGMRAAMSDTYTAAAAAPADLPAEAPALNMVSLVGRVMKNPWHSVFSTSSKATVMVDVKRNRSSKQGRNEIKVVAWNELADYVVSNVQEGAVITLTGELTNNTWQDKQTGEYRSNMEVVADRLQILNPGDAPLIAQQPPPSAPMQAPIAHGEPQSSPTGQQAPHPGAPASSSGPHNPTSPLKPRRIFPKLHSVYTDVCANPFNFADIAASYGIKPYTAINYAFTNWEVQNMPLDLGMIAMVLDIGVTGEEFMELPTLIQTIHETFQEAGTDPSTHTVSVGVVREKLLNTHLQAAIQTQERLRQGPSVTYTQISFAESLYRRGVQGFEVEAALAAARQNLADVEPPVM